MIYFVDIDETICIHESGTDGPRDYSGAEPIVENIDKINKLFDLGHTVVYYTARGAVTGIDWREITEKQLSNWGARYNELRLDKPYYDLLIDDKAINSIDYFKEH